MHELIREQLCVVDCLFPSSCGFQELKKNDPACRWLLYPLSCLSNLRRMVLCMTFVVTVCRYKSNTYKMFWNTLGSFACHPCIPRATEGRQLQASLSVRYILVLDCGQVATECGFLMTKFWSFQSEQWIYRPGLCTEAMLGQLSSIDQVNSFNKVETL